MKKTWIALTLAGALCVPLAGCAGNKTGGDVMPGSSVSPTAQATTKPGVTGADDSYQNNTDAANGGNNVSGAIVGDDASTNATGRNATNGTARSATNGTTGRADNSALEQMGEGIKDTLDDMSSGARRMAQDAKRAME